MFFFVRAISVPMKNSHAHQNVWFFLTPRYESIFLVVPLHILFCNKSYSSTIYQSRFLWNSREVIQFFRHLLNKQVKRFMSKYFFSKTVFKTWTNCTKKRRWILHFEKRIVFLNRIFQKATFLLFHLLQILCKLICSCESCTLPIFINFWKNV